MSRQDIGYLAGCAGVSLGALFYMLCDFGSWPLLMYSPYEGEFLVARSAPSFATMVYPGMLLWGMTGASTGSALVLFIASRAKTAASPKLLLLAGVWTLSLCGLVALYFLWGLWPF